MLANLSQARRDLIYVLLQIGNIFKDEDKEKGDSIYGPSVISIKDTKAGP